MDFSDGNLLVEILKSKFCSELYRNSFWNLLEMTRILIFAIFAVVIDQVAIWSMSWGWIMKFSIDYGLLEKCPFGEHVSVE
jgi:hypothetical protein